MRPLSSKEKGVFKYVRRYLDLLIDEDMGVFGVCKDAIDKGDALIDQIRVLECCKSVNYVACKLCANETWKGHEPHYLGAMTLGTTIVLTRPPDHDDLHYRMLLAHEFVHVFQAQTPGFWGRLMRERWAHGLRGVYTSPGTLEHSADRVQDAYKHTSGIHEEDVELII